METGSLKVLSFYDVGPTHINQKSYSDSGFLS